MSRNTIVAISTPAGRGALGVIRICGSESLSLVKNLVRDLNFRPNPRYAYLKKLFDPDTQQVIDQALITFFESPYSYTGEDTFEVSCHGSPVVLSRIVNVLVGLGARTASPGEFTMRAVASGKINLSQAEAVKDLIDAQTQFAASQALKQLSGELSFRLGPIKSAIIALIAQLESSVEFVEDDLPDLFYSECKTILQDIAQRLSNLQSTYTAGQALNNGFKVALAGKPNVGKSSLFNALLSYERAIVTAHAGTTRDSISEHLDIGDYPVTLFDTAGVREDAGEIEVLGIERTKRLLADADLVIVIFDGSVDLQPEDHHILQETSGLKRLIVINKTDLGFNLNLGKVIFNPDDTFLQISAKTGSGLEQLKSAINNRLSSQIGHCEQDLIITNVRHYDLLDNAVVSLGSCISLLEQNAPEELLLVHLHDALRFVGAITGETTADDVLGEIFSTFCIGK